MALAILVLAGAGTILIIMARHPGGTRLKQAVVTTGNPYSAGKFISEAQASVASAKTAQDKTSAYTSLGSAYLNNGQAAAAITAYQSAVTASNSSNLDALVGLANAYYTAGDRQKTIDTYQKIVILLQQPNPSDPQVAMDSGELGWYQQAIQRLQRGGQL